MRLRRSALRYVCSIVVLVLAGALPLPALAQPFGIQAGTPLRQLEVIKEVGPFEYKVKAPRPHPEFESYVVIVTPGQGVCEVLGVGIDYENDA